MQRVLIKATPLLDDWTAKPAVLIVPVGGAVIEVDNAAKFCAGVDAAAMQDFDMVQQNVSRLHFGGDGVRHSEVFPATRRHFIRPLIFPQMAAGNDPDAAIGDGRAVGIDVYVKNALGRRHRVSVPMPGNGGAIARQFKDQRLVAGNKVGADHTRQQIADKRAGQQPQRERIGVGMEIGQIIRDALRAAQTLFIRRAARPYLINQAGGLGLKMA